MPKQDRPCCISFVEKFYIEFGFPEWFGGRSRVSNITSTVHRSMQEVAVPFRVAGLDFLNQSDGLISRTGDTPRSADTGMLVRRLSEEILVEVVILVGTVPCDRISLASRCQEDF